MTREREQAEDRKREERMARWEKELAEQEQGDDDVSHN
jgi:hypothetical protein